jgi:heat shock protein HtpX
VRGGHTGATGLPDGRPARTLGAMATTRTSFGSDRGLQARMLLTMFLLGLLYVGLIAALLYAGTGAIGMLVIVAGLALAQLFLSDKIALRAMGAHEVSPSEAPGLHALIERLCVQADLPKPKVAIADTHVPNAFAMGRSQKAATVCVTTGLLHLLEPHELEGVVAHELAHVQHRDVLIMTVASFFASIAAMVVQFAPFLGGSRDREGGHPAFIVVMLVSVVVYLLSFVLMLALSRHREFVADRGAAVMTGRPSALSSALMKISGAMSRVPDRDLRVAAEMNAFFIVPAGVKGSLRSIMSTHPPMEQRIAALQRIEAALQGGSARTA